MSETAPLSAEEADQLARMRYRRALARKKRKEREAASEVKELNITAMMDMMTIILVFLLKSFASSSAAITASEDVRPPVSSTRATPKDTVAITITPKNIMVGDKEVVRLENGRIPANQLQGERLVLGLDAQLKKEVQKLKYIEERNPAAPFTHELSVIADKMVPYDLLLTVLYTAGVNELQNYRFIVLQRDAE
ncbi:biopolymer transporter ExbD [Corallococcus exiguus]|uniref:Biopolymer transporter ExbD n=1 Tax=Corallococcus exiguus TaxID=83462 RepID=A0A7X5BTL2_9BACT|nr:MULTISPECIES: biopolymer transporter ExbD [Corallococcus]NBC45481.1 biopolymer transporter ExbD [Corallococcus exiguus]NRD57215.1 biopolymer transporter ExbD [Corallococcus exiguus]NRD63648.1 biopolymer transporter ExbD [Corallococcus exiguus]RKH28851.1 biopolymer transporter ExbD [Corallococcus sp. CA041A]RKI14048.1 biopolymer transporter ExbD [Corallococcus sp. AB030]